MLITIRGTVSSQAFLTALGSLQMILPVSLNLQHQSEDTVSGIRVLPGSQIILITF